MNHALAVMNDHKERFLAASNMSAVNHRSLNTVNGSAKEPKILKLSQGSSTMNTVDCSHKMRLLIGIREPVNS